MQNCPCGTNKNYTECCGIYIDGGEAAPTPECLMRSRYTAYARDNMTYIMETMKPPASDRYSEELAQVNKNITWLGLEVVNAKHKTKTGQVEFIARYRLADREFRIHELSEFVFEQGKWYYKDGIHKDVETTPPPVEKTGRNEDCPCGSGKKFKKCCG